MSASYALPPELLAKLRRFGLSELSEGSLWVFDHTYTRDFGYFRGDTFVVSLDIPDDDDDPHVLAVTDDSLVIGFLTRMPATNSIEIETDIEPEGHNRTITLPATALDLLYCPRHNFNYPSAADMDPQTDRFRIDAPHPAPPPQPQGRRRIAKQARHFQEVSVLLNTILASGGKSTVHQLYALADAINDWGNEIRIPASRGPNKQTAMQSDWLLEQLAALYRVLKAKKLKRGVTASDVFGFYVDVYQHSAAGCKAIHKLLEEPSR